MVVGSVISSVWTWTVSACAPPVDSAARKVPWNVWTSGSEPVLADATAVSAGSWLEAGHVRSSSSRCTVPVTVTSDESTGPSLGAVTDSAGVARAGSGSKSVRSPGTRPWSGWGQSYGEPVGEAYQWSSGCWTWNGVVPSPAWSLASRMLSSPMAPSPVVSMYWLIRVANTSTFRVDTHLVMPTGSSV
jgi:hypothetical protein